MHKLQIASAIQTREARSCMQRTALNTMARKRNTFIRCCTGACSLCIAWRRPACSGMRDCTFMCAPRHFNAITRTILLNACQQVRQCHLLLLGHSCQWPKQRMASSCTSLEHVLQGAEPGQTLVQAACRHHIAFTLGNNNSHWNIHDACACNCRTGWPHRIGKHIRTLTQRLELALSTCAPSSLRAIFFPQEQL